MDEELKRTVSVRDTGLDARRGIVRLHPEVMRALAISKGDPVRLGGVTTTAALVAESDPTTGVQYLVIDDVTRSNLGVRDGAEVTVSRLPAVAARRVTLAGPAGLQDIIKPHTLQMALLSKVVTAGDKIALVPQDVLPNVGPHDPNVKTSLYNQVGSEWRTALLDVVEVVGAESAVISADTVLGWQGGPIASPVPGPTAEPESLAPADPEVPPLSIEDLPGLRTQAKELEELLDLGFNHGEVLARLGTSVSLGVLISGPAGSGKSALVRTVAAQVEARVIQVWSPSLAALTNTAAAGRLRELAREARDGGPTVLLFVDVDALAPRDEPGPISIVFREVMQEILRDGVAVVATTNRPEAVDTSLRSPDLLALQLVVPLPDAAMRLEQLRVITKRIPLATDVVLDTIAGRTPGFVAADLGALAREAAVRAALRQTGSADEPLSDDDAQKVTMADFEAALDVVRPTSMAESTLEVAAVTLDDVGDMVEVKQVLTESVLWPLTYPDTFARLGVSPPRGVLLYGPPGCGKTFLVKAIAGTGKANVLSVKGAELLSKWVGDSEKAVRELFRRAREAAPTLVFLDEIDALAPTRGQGTDGGTADRVVASLLTELDGVEDLRNVVVIGATNRPDLIDPALLRPGRLERLVYVPPPDAEARAAILKASSKSVPLDPTVDLVALGEELEGFSAADCAALIRESALAAMRDSLEATTVTAENVATARQRVRASLDPDQVAWLEAYAEKRQA
ncbi:AAA family ATPase [Actinoplanes bogorensis]|uniref:AAA family ATPase n=1 Tax=Paractinoplanes bogorensis TaxID=1610840 RepID=A0ABS5YI91_9ACTN|nr:AAA family ATPase [Actinoplanes bogorensis]MBU2663185.1 AAA family ATPase [Actinoplanes bogorensis]